LIKQQIMQFFILGRIDFHANLWSLLHGFPLMISALFGLAISYPIIKRGQKLQPGEDIMNVTVP